MRDVLKRACLLREALARSKGCTCSARLYRRIERRISGKIHSLLVQGVENDGH